jgi:hypothetical protein
LVLAPTNTAPDSCVNAADSGGAELPKSFCPFSNQHVVSAYPPPSDRFAPLVLTFDPKDIKPRPPNFFPVWSVAVDKRIMVDHDDFWNPEIVRLIGILFADAYEQSQKLPGPSVP